MEEEQRKFEDEEFLSNYFSEMRKKIQKDMANINTYFPLDLSRGDASKLYSDSNDSAHASIASSEIIATALSMQRKNDVQIKKVFSPKTTSQIRGSLMKGIASNQDRYDARLDLDAIGGI